MIGPVAVYGEVVQATSEAVSPHKDSSRTDGDRTTVHFKNVPDGFQTLSILYKISQTGAVSVFTVGREEGENNLKDLLETASLHPWAPRTSVLT
jgi:hypothetical protein